LTTHSDASLPGTPAVVVDEIVGAEGEEEVMSSPRLLAQTAS
jgi:hypothetical protein